MPDYQELLGIGGLFEKNIPGFKPRLTQQALAEAVHMAIQGENSLIAEAGTGTGKTFAYLIPALLSGKKILISSGTRTLQDQLFQKDLPIVRNVLGAPVKTALLKGRSNYICLHRLGIAASNTQDLFYLPNQINDLMTIQNWARVTCNGDTAEIGSVSESSPLWQLVTSTADNCLGQDCNEYERCHVLQARRKAQDADLVIVNHHLLLADMLLKEEGFASILPGVDAIIVDEAHQLQEIASQHFGVSVSSQKIQALLRECRNDYLAESPDVTDFQALIEATSAILTRVQQQCQINAQYIEWKQITKSTDIKESLQEIYNNMVKLGGALEVISEHSAGLKNCMQRVRAHTDRILQFVDIDDDDTCVRWVERTGNGFRLNMLPMNTASRFNTCMLETGCPWIFLSASISVNGGFKHFREHLGINEADEMLFGSPYDYEHNALLFMPQNMPDVNSPGYTYAVIQAALPLIKSAGGRSFLLFTSRKAMQEAAVLVRNLIQYPVLVQGDSPRHKLLEKFRELGNAVLLGTASFWEGVDVKGRALSVVVIDKLPFASPSDPVIKARLNALEQQGREPFIEYQLPEAVLTLKQGIGRLIRDDADKGVLMLCDPRLTKRGYGKIFLESLPPMRRTRDLQEVIKFLADILPAHAGDVRI